MRGKWKSFSAWARSHGLKHARKASVQQIAEFLNYLFEDKTLQLSTIKGYRAAICRVIKLSGGADLSDDPHLAALLRNFALERPVVRSSFPKWDLGLVLSALTKPPYEPLGAASLLHLSRKTAFLLLLATGARQGEVHALDIDHTLILDRGNTIWLKPNRAFMAKNFNPQTGSGQFSGFKISQAGHVHWKGPTNGPTTMPGPGPEPLPHHEPRRRRGNIKQLFLACRHQRALVGPASQNTLSSWTRHTIAEAYGIHGGHPATSMLHRSTHEIRAIVFLHGPPQQCRHGEYFKTVQVGVPNHLHLPVYLRDVKTQQQGLHCLTRR